MLIVSELNLGDEVVDENGDYGIVIDDNANYNGVYIFWGSHSTTHEIIEIYCNTDSLHKTGRHYKQVLALDSALYNRNVGELNEEKSNHEFSDAIADAAMDMFGFNLKKGKEKRKC